MKAMIESTDVVTELDGQRARVWQGVTEQGIPFLAFIARCAVETDQDDTEFQQLSQAAPPRELDIGRVFISFSSRML